MPTITNVNLYPFAKPRATKRSLIDIHRNTQPNTLERSEPLYTTLGVP